MSQIRYVKELISHTSGFDNFIPAVTIDAKETSTTSSVDQTIKQYTNDLFQQLYSCKS